MIKYVIESLEASTLSSCFQKQTLGENEGLN